MRRKHMNYLDKLSFEIISVFALCPHCPLKGAMVQESCYECPEEGLGKL